MKCRPSPAIALCLSASLLLQGVGCSSTGSTAVNANASTEPEVIATRDALYTLDTGTKVIISLKDGSAMHGWFEGMDDIVSRKVFMVLPPHLPQVVDILEAWVPIQDEPIIVYKYPSYEIYMEGKTDFEAWDEALKSDRHIFQFMTQTSTELPRFNVRFRYIPQYGSFSHVIDIPSEKIHQILVHPEQPLGKAGQAAIGVGVLAVGAVVICTVAYFVVGPIWLGF